MEKWGALSQSNIWSTVTGERAGESFDLAALRVEREPVELHSQPFIPGAVLLSGNAAALTHARADRGRNPRRKIRLRL
jgi:hypothetical protein